MKQRAMVMCSMLAGALSAAPLSGQILTEATFGGGTYRTATGPGPIATVKLGRRLLGNVLLGEVNAAYATSREDVSFFEPRQRTHVGMLDLQAQLQLPLSRMRPYVGAGIGSVRYLGDYPSGSKTKPSSAASIGARVIATSSMLIRVDYRFREWRSPLDAGFFRNSKELTLSAGWHR